MVFFFYLSLNKVHLQFKLYYKDLYALNVVKKQQSVVLNVNLYGIVLVIAKKMIGKNIRYYARKYQQNKNK